MTVQELIEHLQAQVKLIPSSANADVYAMYSTSRAREQEGVQYVTYDNTNAAKAKVILYTKN